MNGYFDISFSAGQLQHTATVHPRYHELDVYFEIRVHDSGEDELVLFVEMNNTGEWVQKTGIRPQPVLSPALAAVIGQQIEKNERLL